MNIVVLGSLDPTADELTRLYAHEMKHRLALVDSNPHRLQRQQKDLNVRGADSLVYPVDLNEWTQIPLLLQKIYEDFQKVDLLLYFSKTESKEKGLHSNPAKSLRYIENKLTTPCLVLNYFALFFEKQKSGQIAVMSAAPFLKDDTALLRNSSMAFRREFLKGLRKRLRKSQVALMDIRPADSLQENFDDPFTEQESHLQKARLLKTQIKTGTRVSYLGLLPSFFRFVFLKCCRSFSKSTRSVKVL